MKIEEMEVQVSLCGGENLREAVEALLESDLSAYSISKESGVPYMTVNDLLSGDVKLDETEFATVEKLYEFAETINTEDKDA